jgi:hypothetical protein
MYKVAHGHEEEFGKTGQMSNENILRGGGKRLKNNKL